jgi:dienelactone hydrolase
MRTRVLGVAVVVLTAAMSVAAAQDRIGVVLLHGKQSAPEQHEPLASAMAAAGFPVERPEMCWSGRRIYDRDYPGCLRDIDSAVDRLRQQGVTALVIAGHSLGANGALAYGARNTVKRPATGRRSWRGGRGLPRISNARAGSSPKAAASVRRALPTTTARL